MICTFVVYLGLTINTCTITDFETYHYNTVFKKEPHCRVRFIDGSHRNIKGTDCSFITAQLVKED